MQKRVFEEFLLLVQYHNKVTEKQQLRLVQPNKVNSKASNQQNTDHLSIHRHQTVHEQQLRTITHKSVLHYAAAAELNSSLSS